MQEHYEEIWEMEINHCDLWLLAVTSSKGIFPVAEIMTLNKGWKRKSNAITRGGDQTLGSFTIGTLRSDDDGDGNENVKKKNRFN